MAVLKHRDSTRAADPALDDLLGRDSLLLGRRAATHSQATTGLTNKPGLLGLAQAGSRCA